MGCFHLSQWSFTRPSPTHPTPKGHGICDHLSRSLTLARFTDAPRELADQAGALLRALAVPPLELRGLGITVSRLDNDAASQGARAGSAVPVARYVEIMWKKVKDFID